MKSVLFVCLGNICRSPLAEGILRHKTEKYEIKMKIDSAGTGHWHIGESPDKRAAAVAKKHGIDISKLVARQIQKEDFDMFDLILVADAEVRGAVDNLARNDTDRQRVDFMMNMAYPGSDMEVPDPYYGGADSFERVFSMLDKVCESLMEKIRKK